MLRYVGDQKFAKVPVAGMLSKDYARERAKLIDLAHAKRDGAGGRRRRWATTRPTCAWWTRRGTWFPTSRVTIQLLRLGRGGGRHRLCAAESRGAVQPQGRHPNVLAGRKRPLHTIIPAFMSKDEVRIAFGIMGGWNQSQAHAQFVSNVVDHRMNIQAALEAPRFTKQTFEGTDVEMESRIAGGGSRQAGGQRPHDPVARFVLRVRRRRTGGDAGFCGRGQLRRLGPAQRRRGDSGAVSGDADDELSPCMTWIPRGCQPHTGCMPGFQHPKLDFLAGITHRKFRISTIVSPLHDAAGVGGLGPWRRTWPGSRGDAGLAGLPLLFRVRPVPFSDSLTLIVFLGMSISTMSPFFTRPIGPPTAASGLTWPMQAPRVPPEKRPSVIRATDSPSPAPMM